MNRHGDVMALTSTGIPINIENATGKKSENETKKEISKLSNEDSNHLHVHTYTHTHARARAHTERKRTGRGKMRQ